MARASAPHSTRLTTRSGWVAANSTDIGAPSEAPSNVARVNPASSITALRSSIRVSSVGTSATGSESPVPRLSNVMTRANDASRLMARASGGNSHASST